MTGQQVTSFMQDSPERSYGEATGFVRVVRDANSQRVAFDLQFPEMEEESGGLGGVSQADRDGLLEILERDERQLSELAKQAGWQVVSPREISV